MNLGTCLGNIACEGEIWIRLYRENKYSETNQRRIIDDKIDSKRKHIFMHERIQYSTNRIINYESYENPTNRRHKRNDGQILPNSSLMVKHIDFTVIMLYNEAFS